MYYFSGDNCQFKFFFFKFDDIILDLSLFYFIDNLDMIFDDFQLIFNDQYFVEVNFTVYLDRIYFCLNCSKGFKSKQQFVQYSLVYIGIRKYICLFCDKGFK